MMMTSTSKIYLSAQANDPDGRLVGVQFYVNGNKYRDEILFDPLLHRMAILTGSGGARMIPTMIRITHMQMILIK